MHRLRVSRSQLYATALSELLDRQQTNDVTERLNEVYSRRPAKVDSALHRAQIRFPRQGLLVMAMDDIHRGEIWWADLPEPRRSELGFRRPVLVVQAARAFCKPV